MAALDFWKADNLKKEKSISKEGKIALKSFLRIL